MAKLRTFIISQAERPLVTIEASSSDAAISRAKGLGNILDFSPSLPLEATEATCASPESIPQFSNDYFELLGFTR